jgi:poly(3-hydroxybutyrate) depolymerase
MTFIRAMGRDVNLVAICQPAVAAIAAVSLMAQANEEETPATLALLAGPVDPRVNPTQVNDFAVGHTIEQFRNSAVDYVPCPLFGMGRKVYPGFRQVGGFMSMNMSHHLSKHKEHFAAMVRHDEAEDTSAHRAFYDEYCSVMDLTAEFYLDTVARVFQLFQLPRGQFVCNGRLVEPRAITKTAVLAIEGGQDDITGIGQTKAVFELLTNLPKKKQGYHLEAEAGHYGVFSGRRFRENIEPQIRQFILTHN